MNRFASLSLLTGLLTFVGCGSSTAPTADVDSSDTTPTTAPATPPVTPAVAAAAVESPANVVSQFLDEIRRGGEDTLANDLLTQKAQSELKRIGQSVQPIGSPAARFEVTRFEKVPNDPSSALVHSIWSEPTNGPSSEFQVVWAVHLEPAGWRISGLAMELDPNQPPLVIDFENGDLMARLLSQQVDQAANSTQATAVDPTISR